MAKASKDTDSTPVPLPLPGLPNAAKRVRVIVCCCNAAATRRRSQQARNHAYSTAGLTHSPPASHTHRRPHTLTAEHANAQTTSSTKRNGNRDRNRSKAKTACIASARPTTAPSSPPPRGFVAFAALVLTIGTHQEDQPEQHEHYGCNNAQNSTRDSKPLIQTFDLSGYQPAQH